MRPEFTRWWLFAKIQAMRARQRKLSAAEMKMPRRIPVQTWTMCLNRARCKMRELYLDKRNPAELKTNDAWDYCIIWQRGKLLRQFDPVDAWRKTETRLLDKMNAHNFPADATPNVPWKSVVNRQVWKAHQRLAKEFVRGRTPTDSFDQVIRQGKERLRQLYFKVHGQPDDDVWIMTIRANKLRIHTTHIRNDWIQTICENKYKILQREAEPKFYRQRVFW